MRRTRLWCQTSRERRLLSWQTCCWGCFRGTRRIAWILPLFSVTLSWNRHQLLKNHALCQCLHALVWSQTARVAALLPVVTSLRRPCQTCRLSPRMCCPLHLSVHPTTCSCPKSRAAAPAARTLPVTLTTLCWCPISLENSHMTFQWEQRAAGRPVNSFSVEGHRSHPPDRLQWYHHEARPRRYLCPHRYETTSVSNRTCPAAQPQHFMALPGQAQCGAPTQAPWASLKCCLGHLALQTLFKRWGDVSLQEVPGPTPPLH